MTGRKKTPPLQAEREALIRVASLAAAALVQLRKPGRGRYDSERQLAGWIKDAGVQFSASDLGPALGLAEGTGRLVRPAVGPNTPRPGELATSGALARDADLYANAELPRKARIAALINNVIRALSAGPQCLEEQLQGRLVAKGVVPDPDDLDIAISRLLDSGRLMAPRPRPTSDNPNPQRVLIMANLGHTTWVARGWGGQLIAVVPEHQLVVAIGSVPTNDMGLEENDVWLWVNDAIVPALG